MHEERERASDARDAHDEATLKAVAAGDRAAFERLFRRHHRPVQGFVRRMVERPDLVDEVVNDTLFVVWLSAGTFPGRSSVSAWIFGIAYRLALQGLGERARHERLSDGDRPLERASEPSARHDPEAQTMTGSRIEALESALARLDADQRAVLELAALGHSQEEIAAVIDCPSEVVKKQLLDARRKLRRHEHLARVAEV